MTTRQIIAVTVNDLDPSGRGVTCHNGKALFMPELLPQGNVEVVTIEDKKQLVRAQIKRRSNDSPQREVSCYPHFGMCGGYQQQHASISLQQRSKSAALSRLVKCGVPDILAGAPRDYRRRARLSPNYRPKKQKLQIGFRKSGFNDIVDVKQCLILMPQLEASLPHLKVCLESLQGLRHLGHVELIQAGSGTLMILRHTASLSAMNKEKLECFSYSQGLSPLLAP